MARTKRQDVGWWEPLRFQRRSVLRFLRGQRLAFIRWSIYGLLAAVLGDFLMTQLNAPLFMPRWQYYLSVGFALPSFLITVMLLTALVSRHVAIRPRGIVIQNGQANLVIAPDRVIDAQIRWIECTPPLAILRLRFRSRRGKMRHVTIGISSRMEPDRVLRSIWIAHRYCSIRLWKRDSSRRDMIVTEHSVTQPG